MRILSRNRRTADSTRNGELGEFLTRWCRGYAACALGFLLLTAMPARASWIEQYRLGEGLLKQGRPDDAVREFRLALADQPDNPAILDAIGRAEMEAGRYRSARSYFEKEIRIRKGEPVSQTNLALSCMALGDYRRAEQILKQEIVAAAGSLISRRALAQTLYLQGRLEEAASILEEIVAERVDKTARSDLALIYEARRQPARARELVLQAIAESPPGRARVRLLANLGVLHWKLGARRESEAAFQDALAEAEAAAGKNHPDTAWILAQYGLVLRLQGRKKEARTLDTRAERIRSSFVMEGNERRHTVDWREIAKPND